MLTSTTIPFKFNSPPGDNSHKNESFHCGFSISLVIPDHQKIKNKTLFLFFLIFFLI